MLVMRKRFRVLMLAALVAALVVPVGFALSLESAPGWRSTRRATFASDVSTFVAASVVVPVTNATDVTHSFPHSFPDAAKLLIVGSVLIGLAAVVRKAS
jgi:hypothetical protein